MSKNQVRESGESALVGSPGASDSRKASKPTKRPLWPRLTDPDDPLIWGQRLSYLAIVLAVLSVIVNVIS